MEGHENDPFAFVYIEYADKIHLYTNIYLGPIGLLYFKYFCYKFIPSLLKFLHGINPYKKLKHDKNKGSLLILVLSEISEEKLAPLFHTISRFDFFTNFLSLI